MRDAKIFQVSLASSLLCYFFVTVHGGTTSAVFGESSFVEEHFLMSSRKNGISSSFFGYLEALRQKCVAREKENFLAIWLAP